MNDKYLQQLLLDHFPGVALLLRTTTREVVATNQAGIDVGIDCGSRCFETWSRIKEPCPWCLAPELWATGKEQQVEIKAGGKIWEAHWVPVDGDIYLHYSIDITDRTERKRAEERLAEKDQLIQQSLSLNRSFTFDWNIGTDRVQRSDSCKNIFGIDSIEMCDATAKTFSERLHPDDRQRFVRTLRSLTPTANTYIIDFRLLLSNGNVVTIEETAQAFFDDKGKIQRVIGVATDISERKQNEKQILRRSAVLNGINRIFEMALLADTTEQLGEKCLEVLEQITGSRISFIGEINANGLEDIAISNPGWELCTMYDKAGHRRPPGNFKIHGIYGRVISGGKAFFTNDPESHPDSIGLPSGHPSLESFLGVPLTREGRVIGMIGLGNRQDGYSLEEQEDVEAIVPAIVQAFVRRAAEEALQRERDVLQAVIDGAKKSHLVYLDRNFNFVRVNKTYAATCGYAPDEMIGKNHFALYPHPENEAIFERVRDTGEAFEIYDKPFEFPDQPERGITYWDWTLTPVKNVGGQVTGLIFSLFETTDRKRAEQALQESQRRLSEIVERSPSFICILSGGQHTFEFANEKYLQVVGRRDIIGKKLVDALPEIATSPYPRILDRVFQTGEPFSAGETSLMLARGADGKLEEVWLDFVYLPMREPDGSVSGVFVHGIDITERKRAEEELRRLNDQLEQRVLQRTRFYTLIASINDAIVKYRDRQELLTEICRILVEIGGFKLSWVGMLDMASREIKPEASWGETSYLEGIKLTANDEPEGMGPSDRAIVEGRHIVSVDFEKEARMLPWRDRARTHGIRSSSVFPLFSAGRVIGELTIYSDEPSYFTEEEISLLLSIANNISYALDAISIEQKRLKAEEALKQLNEELEQRVSVRTLALEEANRELEAFSYSASHDLRAPLRHLSGFVDLLRNELQDKASIKAQNYMKSIAKASKKMGILIDDLLSFSRIGRSEMKMRMINLNVIVKDVIGELQAETTGRDITWELEVLPDVYGDQSLFRMVFVNLISNAIKFTRTVAHAEISVRSEDRGKEFIFYVKDNGVGFDMKYMSKLFGVFQRLHTESEFEGTGIGLANVQRIIARHGGRTWAEGAVGGGATIYFSLPKLEKV